MMRQRVSFLRLRDGRLVSIHYYVSEGPSRANSHSVKFRHDDDGATWKQIVPVARPAKDDGGPA